MVREQVVRAEPRDLARHVAWVTVAERPPPAARVLYTRHVDNGAPPSGKSRARAGTKPRPSEPVDPRTEAVQPVGNRHADESASPGSSGNGTGNGHGPSLGQKAKRRLASSLLRPREPVIDAPDAPAPEPAESVAGTGPVLLPPISTTPAAADGIVAPATPEAHVAPATPTTVAPAPTHAAPSATGAVHAPSRVMPFVRPPAPPEVTPGELVAKKVVAPPVGGEVLDVALEPDPTESQPLVARAGRPSITFQRRRTRARVRRVTRVVRHIDTWSVFKVALVFSAFLYAVVLTAGVLLWHVAIATGTVDNVERFFEGFGWQTFKFKGGEIYHNAWIGGLFVAIGLTGVAVLVATMFNLITDLVGGIRVSVLEEEVLARRDRTARVVVDDDPEETAPYDQARSG